MIDQIGVLSARLTKARALLIDNIDVTVTSRIAGSSYTAGRAAKLDRADAAVSGRMPQSSATVPVVYPSLAAYAAPASSATAWTFGAWVQIVAASTLSSHALVAVLWQSSSYDAQLEIGTGGAGSEVVIARLAAVGWGLMYEDMIAWLNPPITIGANARVAVRVADASGIGQTGRAACVFQPRPF